MKEGDVVIIGRRAITKQHYYNLVSQMTAKKENALEGVVHSVDNEKKRVTIKFTNSPFVSNVETYGFYLNEIEKKG